MASDNSTKINVTYEEVAGYRVDLSGSGINILKCFMALASAICSICNLSVDELAKEMPGLVRCYDEDHANRIRIDLNELVRQQGEEPHG